MTDIHRKSVQTFGYLRAIGILCVAIIILFACIKGEALAPHAPDISLTKELDMRRESSERQRDQKAHNKVETYKDFRKTKKETRVTDKKKERVKKPDKSKSKHGHKPKKTPKPPKPSKQDKKNANKHKVRTMS